MKRREFTALALGAGLGIPLGAVELEVPSLRGVSSRAPYIHAGQFRTLREVLEHYRRAATAEVGQSELEPLPLSDRQLDDIEEFLATLDGGIAAPPRFLSPPKTR